MPKFTENLNLLKVDPTTDGNETFNLDVVLNNNWDKVDKAVKAVEDGLDKIEVPVASLTKPGIVQLSNSTAGARENVAATEKAVGVISAQLTGKAPLSNPGFTGTAWVNGNEALHQGNMKTILETDPTKDLVQVTVGTGKQFATITAALAALKKINAGERQIRVATGHVETANQLRIEGFIGGEIIIMGDNLQNYSVKNNVYITDNSANVVIQNMVVDGGQIKCFGTNSLRLSGVTQKSGTGFSASDVPYVLLNYCEFSNLYRGVSFDRVALAVLVGVIGTGNTTGIISNSSIVMKGNQTTITGTTPQEKYGGGQIFG